MTDSLESKIRVQVRTERGHERKDVILVHGHSWISTHKNWQEEKVKNAAVHQHSNASRSFVD